MKNFFFLFILFLFSCSSDTNKIQGDLFFKLVDSNPRNGFSKEQALEIISKIKNQKSSETVSISDKKTIAYLNLLEKNNLLESPFIYLKKSDTTYKIFLSKKEYEKVKSYILSDLNKKNKKVEIELEYVLKDSLYYSYKIISIKESEGKTPWKK